MAIDKTETVGRFGCFKVIPLIFDEALSYYEVVCKLRTSLNEVIEQANAIVNELGLTDAEIDELKQIVGEGSVDDRIYGAELAAKAYTDEVTEPLDARLDALEEGATITVAMNTTEIISADVTGDLSKGVKKVTVISPGSSASSNVVPTDCHMYSFASYEYQSPDYMLRFWHCIGPYSWKHVSVCLVRSGSTWDVDQTRSSVLTLT